MPKDKGFIPYPAAFCLSLDHVHAAARRWCRLIFAWKPFYFFARAVAFNREFGAAHVGEFDFDCVAGIHRLEPFMEGAGSDDIAGVETDEASQPAYLIGDLMRH